MAGEEQAQDLGRRQRPLRLQLQQGGADLLGQAGGDSRGARPRQQVAVDDARVFVGMLGVLDGAAGQPPSTI